MKCKPLYFSLSQRYQENLILPQGSAPVLTLYMAGAILFFGDFTSAVPGSRWAVTSHANIVSSLLKLTD